MTRKEPGTTFIGLQKPNPRVNVQSFAHLYDAATDARRRLMAMKDIARHPSPLASVAAKTAKRWSKLGKLSGFHAVVFASAIVEILAHDPVVHAYLESVGLPSPAARKRGAR
jgi:hypothetical protein